MLQTQSNFLETANGKIYYEIAGEGHPLVMAHAGFVDSGMWDTQWEELAQHFQVIRYDMIGYGKSDAAKAPISRGEELASLFDQLDIKEAHLIGCSMGGEAIIDFALEYAEKVSALIPVSAVPSGFDMQGAPPAHLFEMIGALQAGDVELASELQIRIWVDGAFRQAQDVNPIVRKHAADMNLIAVKNGTWAIADSQPVNPLNPPAVTRLQDIQVPTLIVAGALDHPEIIRAADMMQGEISKVQKLILSDCAHVPNMEKPAEFNQAVLEFLMAVPHTN